MIEQLQLIYKLILVFLYSYFATLWITKYFIRKFKGRGYVVRDMYKPHKPKIPTMGGFAILCGLMVSLVLSQLIVKEFGTDKLLIFYFIVIVYGVFGLLDDLIQVNRIIKTIAPFFMALPIAFLVSDTNISLIFTTVEIGLFYSLLIAPIYVMVCSNLINMHAGYNGLSGGVSVILMFFIGAKALLKGGDLTLLLYLLPIMGASMGFMVYNKYPSKVFLGNTGTLLLGAGIGSLLIVYNMEIFGIIILIPHIVNFLLWNYWCLTMKKHPHIKWAKLRRDLTIEAPNAFTIKYMVVKLFRVRELRAVLICYAITTVFGIIGLVIV